MSTVGRLVTAMVTPFDGDGNVDYAQAKHLAASLVNAGSEGLVVSGTTGESPTLTKEEKLRLFKEIKGELGDRGAVIAGTGNYSTAESIELTGEAEREGVDAALLVVPYYNRPTQEGLYQHFKAIAESTNLPCILYNVPSRTITSLTWETALRLSQVDNIIGVKEASADFDSIGRIIAGAPDGFNVWSGNDSDTFSIMAMGGYGVVSVASHLVGLQIREMMGLILDGQTALAARKHFRLMPIFKGLFILPNPVPLKYSMNQVGFSVGRPRLPLTEPDEGSAQQLQALLREYTVDLPLPARA